MALSRPQQPPTADGRSWPELSFHRDDLPCTGMGIQAKQGLLNLRWRWQVASYKWQTAFRSFRGHMRLLSPKGKPVLILGRAYTGPVEPADLAELRARNASIESLSAMYPWADLVDQQIFLMGYRAGLERASCTPDIQIAKS
jgi:hypothetical protein